MAQTIAFRTALINMNSVQVCLSDPINTVLLSESLSWCIYVDGEHKITCSHNFNRLLVNYCTAVGNELFKNKELRSFFFLATGCELQEQVLLSHVRGMKDPIKEAYVSHSDKCKTLLWHGKKVFPLYASSSGGRTANAQV